MPVGLERSPVLEDVDQDRDRALELERGDVGEHRAQLLEIARHRSGRPLAGIGEVREVAGGQLDPALALPGQLSRAHHG